MPADRLDAFFRREAERVAGRGGSIDRARRHLERDVEVPAHLPLVEDLLVSSGGQVWLRANTDVGSTWWVIGMDGSRVGSVVVGDDLVLKAIAPPQGGIRLDEFDVPAVVRGTLPEAAWPSAR